jgi:HK97 gp10 family phage protein
MAKGTVSKNTSVEKFKRLTEELRNEVRAEAISELNTQADALVQAIQAVTPVGKTGNLLHSVRKQKTNRPTMVRVAAGGDLTVRPSVSSKPYDYARADEFGTEKMSPKPFFWRTYRKMKGQMIAVMKGRIRSAIRKRSA